MEARAVALEDTELGSLTKFSVAAAQGDDNLIVDLSQSGDLLNDGQDELNKAKAKAVVTFTPAGGKPATEKVTVKLRKRR